MKVLSYVRSDLTTLKSKARFVVTPRDSANWRKKITLKIKTLTLRLCFKFELNETI